MVISEQRGYVERKSKRQEPEGFYVRVTNIRGIFVEYDRFDAKGRRIGQGCCDSTSFVKRFMPKPGDCPSLRDKFAKERAVAR